MKKEKVVKFIQDKVFHSDETLLYLCEFGSHLYGTDTPDSDTDYKGIFLPSLNDLILQKAPKSYRYKTGEDNSRNTNEDTDIELWSLQHFFSKVRTGESNTIALLFSPSHKERIIHKNPMIEDLFKNPLKLFNPADSKAFVGYAIGQAKKYGIKGSRLGVLKNVYEYLNDFYLTNRFIGYYLSDVMPTILEKFYNESYCFDKIENNVSSLVLAGKVHHSTISLKEFFSRVKKDYEKYGKRAEEAERNEGIDWKALSHAMRAIFEMEQLLTSGCIRYPLIERSLLREIKQGKMDFKKVEELIVDGLKRVEELQEETTIKGEPDDKFIESMIINMYNVL